MLSAEEAQALGDLWDWQFSIARESADIFIVSIPHSRSKPV